MKLLHLLSYRWGNILTESTLTQCDSNPMWLTKLSDVMWLATQFISIFPLPLGIIDKVAFICSITVLEMTMVSWILEWLRYLRWKCAWTSATCGPLQPTDPNHLKPSILHQLLSHVFSCTILQFLASLAHGKGCNPENLLHLHLPTYVIGNNMDHDLWLFTLPFQNILCMIRYMFDPGTKEATHYPGVLFICTQDYRFPSHYCSPRPSPPLPHAAAVCSWESTATISKMISLFKRRRQHYLYLFLLAVTYLCGWTFGVAMYPLSFSSKFLVTWNYCF